MSPTPFIDGLEDITDDALQVRDEIGAIKAETKIIHRTWSGSRVGEGTPTEIETAVYPSPYIVDLSHSLRLQQGGTYKQGDVLLKHLSKKRYAENQINGRGLAKNQEFFFEVGGVLYTVIEVVQHYTWFNVQIRRATDQRRYGVE